MSKYPILHISLWTVDRHTLNTLSVVSVCCCQLPCVAGASGGKVLPTLLLVWLHRVYYVNVRVSYVSRLLVYWSRVRSCVWTREVGEDGGGLWDAERCGVQHQFLSSKVFLFCFQRSSADMRMALKARSLMYSVLKFRPWAPPRTEMQQQLCPEVREYILTPDRRIRTNPRRLCTAAQSSCCGVNWTILSCT